MIIAINITIAVLGIILLLVLANQIRKVDAGLKLHNHRKTEAGLNDLLNYAAVVDDGVIVCKNGSFMAAWIYTGDDNASSTEEQRNMVSVRINQALANLGSGWMVHVDAIRRPSMNYPDKKFSCFPDNVSDAIDEERRRFFEGLGVMYDGYFILTVTWFPPVIVQRKFVELMFDDDIKVPSSKEKTRSLIEHFKREVSIIESRLSAAINLTRLKGHKVVNEDGTTSTQDDFLSWLQYCITGKNHNMLLPSNPMYIDSILGGQELWGGVTPMIGRKYIQVVSIEGFPLESSPGILTELAEMPCEYRWDSRFIFLDQHESLRHMEKFRKKWRQKVRGFYDQVFNTNVGPIDKDALSMVEDAEDAIAEIKSGMVAVGYYTSVVVLFDDNRETVEKSARMIEKKINILGFVARVETINTMDAYLGSLPGHGVENVRRPLINTLNLADLIPTSTIWTGAKKAPCPLYPPMSPALTQCLTTGSTPFLLNLHVRDLGHSFIFGPTGTGKSVLLSFLAAQLRRYGGMSIYAFDKGLSLYPLTKAVRGVHFSVAADDDRLAFCPLQFLKTRSDRSWAMEWINTIMALNGVETSPVQRNEIGIAIMSMYESGAKTLSEFSVTVQDELIRETIKQYTVDGTMGHLLDADEDGLSLTDFTTFEIEELMNLGEKYALPVLLYLFRRIERSLTGQPAAIILDEAWIMLGHPAFREKIREWFKVLRKANCIIILATQSLSDAANSGILDVIVESTATKIFLPNLYAHDEDTAALYKRMGLNDRQLYIVASAIPKRQYYYVSERGRRLFELALGPLALSFIASSDKESIQGIKKLERKFGDDWVEEWLENRGLRLADYLEEKVYV